MHLILIYKHQGSVPHKVGAVIDKIIPLALQQIIDFIFLMEMPGCHIISVSYTHLDVYKRQVRG